MAALFDTLFSDVLPPMDSDEGKCPEETEKSFFSEFTGPLNLWGPVRSNSLNTPKSCLALKTE